MTICNAILTPIVTIIHLFVTILRTIVETVCNWVTTTITVIEEVAEKVCSWLPWPLDKICDWVRKLIEVVKTIVEWVCENILKTIVDVIELILEYVIFVLHWVCWIVDWILFRWLALLLCMLGVELKKCIPVCLTILSDRENNPVITVQQAKDMIAASNKLLTQCNIMLEIKSIRIVQKPDLITNVPTGAGQIFNWAFAWFSSNVCDCCSGVTIYFVRSLSNGARGHSIPGTSFILVAVDALVDDATIDHEIGHLSDLWTHSSETGNVMSVWNGTTRTKLSKFQCYMIGSSRFSHACGHRD